MAVKTFDEVYGQLSADEKKLFDSTLTKHPELKEGWLRQDDYSRKLNEFKAKEKTFEEGEQKVARYDTWFEDVEPKWKSLAEKGIVDPETGDELWTAQKTDLEEKLKAAEAAALAGGDMKPEELDKRVQEIIKANGGVTKAEYEALIKSEAKKMAEETFGEQWKAKEKLINEQTIPFTAGFAAAVAVIGTHYEKETGDKYTEEKQAELLKIMAEEKNFNAFKVEEKFLAPYIAKKKEKADQDAEVERRVQERLQATRGLPGSGDEPFIPEAEKQKGALRQMMERSAEAEGDTMSLIMGKAKEAGDQMRSEGKV